MKVLFANVPLWAFPRDSAEWQELRDMETYRLVDGFTNNNLDSRWNRHVFANFTDALDFLRFVLTRLAEDGKTYKIAAIDRNWGLRRPVSDEPSDNEIRKELVLPLKRMQMRVWLDALRETDRLAWIVSAFPSGRLMSGNGAETDDSVERLHFPWDTRGTTHGWAAFERILEASYPGVFQPGDYRHRYWSRLPDGSLYRHYHRTVSVVPSSLVSYSEGGPDSNLGDDYVWWTRWIRTFTRNLPPDGEIAFHGFIDVRAGELKPQYAWHPATVRQLEFPVERAEYHGNMTSEGSAAAILEFLRAGSVVR